ncbi:UDP-glucose 4-epimerase [Candidatus Burkholderia pumila]|uniref:UDP-glucose 4-epimerase n=1 Tax=Candidatus Burkholderia pumila TaxID=1090375 RepID=A0ABR5HLU6_9BURK|nr:UDP-glucose 4-epimerase [Candidatus Burkholderia pumila]
MIFVTGATGFVGRALVARLAGDGIATRACVRRADAVMPAGVETVRMADLSAELDWSEALRSVTVVVHAAARVHVMQDTATDPLAEFRRVNVAGTLKLAEQAAAAGVTRLVFVSSIKVNGEATTRGKPFTAADTPAPLDAYGISKMEAEQGLREIGARTGMEIVVIRPPLVYGPDVKANFQAMMRWFDRGVPLPLGSIHNARSLVALDNLVALIVACLRHPAAANQTFLVSDGEDLSTTELLRRMGRVLDRPARLLPLPASLIGLAASVLGKPAIAQRLCGSLQLDISKTTELLDWNPPLSVEEGLRKAARGYRSEASI